MALAGKSWGVSWRAFSIWAGRVELPAHLARLVVPAQVEDLVEQALDVALHLLGAVLRDPADDVPLPAPVQQGEVVCDLVVGHLAAQLHAPDEQPGELVIQGVDLLANLQSIHY